MGVYSRERASIFPRCGIFHSLILSCLLTACFLWGLDLELGALHGLCSRPVLFWFICSVPVGFSISSLCHHPLFLCLHLNGFLSLHTVAPSSTLMPVSVCLAFYAVGFFVCSLKKCSEGLALCGRSSETALISQMFLSVLSPSAFFHFSLV